MKEINVDTRKYIKAPIDGKNVVEESLLDAIFDDSQYLSNKFSLGFVGGVPTMIEYNGNYLSVKKLCPCITSEWGREIVKRLTGESKNNIYCYKTKQYLDERQAEPLIYTFSLSTDYLTVRFHYNVKVDED